MAPLPLSQQSAHTGAVQLRQTAGVSAHRQDKDFQVGGRRDSGECCGLLRGTALLRAVRRLARLARLRSLLLLLLGALLLVLLERALEQHEVCRQVVQHGQRHTQRHPGQLGRRAPSQDAPHGHILQAILLPRICGLLCWGRAACRRAGGTARTTAGAARAADGAPAAALAAHPAAGSTAQGGRPLLHLLAQQPALGQPGCQA